MFCLLYEQTAIVSAKTMLTQNKVLHNLVNLTDSLGFFVLEHQASFLHSITFDCIIFQGLAKCLPFDSTCVHFLTAVPYELRENFSRALNFIV